MHNDNPASRREEDKFQRYDFAKRLASIVGSHMGEKSLVVGLYGKWGEGKTSVMNFIELELPEATIVVKFNPWLFSDQQHLLISFFESIAKAIGSSTKTGNEKVGEFFSEYAQTIGAFTKLFGLSMDGLEVIANKLKNVTVEETKGRVDRLIKDSGKTIVVFVDDIDRLDVHEVQSVFKLVKLVGDFPNTSYVLSFDDEMVSTALAPKYGSIDKGAGYNFLEKIVQLPVRIPKASAEALTNYTFNLVNELLETHQVEMDKNESIKFVNVFNSSFLPVLNNPRFAIRYVNTLSVSLPLLIGEVHIGNLMIIEAAKIFYPELYDFIRNNQTLFLDHGTKAGSTYEYNVMKNKEIKDSITIIVDRYGNQKAIIIKLLQHLFPQMKRIFGNQSYSGEIYTKWTKEKRICSARYFSRYFAYSIQQGEMPDSFFDNIIDTLDKASLELVVDKIKFSIEQYSAFDLILRFGMHIDDLSYKQSISLANSIARIGDSFPAEGDFKFATPYALSAKLIRDLILKLPKEDQFALSLDIFKNVQTIEYALEIHYWLMYHDEKYTDEKIFSLNEKEQIQGQILEMFLQVVNHDNFFSAVVGEHNLEKLLLWWAVSKQNKKTLKSFLSKELRNKKNHAFALRLIKIFVPTIVSSNYNETDFSTYNRHEFKANFYEDCYSSIKQVVDVQLLNQNLTKVYKMKPLDKKPEELGRHDMLDDKEIVSIFQWFLENDNDAKVVSH